MNEERQLQPAASGQDDQQELQRKLERTRLALAEAEADLAREQAAVNAFRMHARLKLDSLVDSLMALRSEREALLVKLEFLRQGVNPVDVFDDDVLPEVEWPEESTEENEVLLPTLTPGDKAAEKRLYRELARRFHPDLATTTFERSYRTTMMSAINNAYSERNSEALYDLAGELSPEEAASLAQIPHIQTRRIRKTIIKMNRLRHKARRQLAALRLENTARLWRRAETLEENDEDGWAVIRSELQGAIEHREREIDKLTRQVEKFEQLKQED